MVYSQLGEKTQRMIRQQGQIFLNYPAQTISIICYWHTATSEHFMKKHFLPKLLSCENQKYVSGALFIYHAGNVGRMSQREM